MDITFKAENGKFNLRVGALICSGGKLLLATSPLEGEDVYYSVGGRVKYGETLYDAIKRELREETGIDCSVVRMAALHENFFVNVEGYPYHEISAYFLVDVSDDLAAVSSGHLTEGGPDKEHLEWIDPTDDRYTIYPPFFRDMSLWEDIACRHYVTCEEEGTTVRIS